MNERILYQSGLHPVAYAGPVLALCVAVLLVVNNAPVFLPVIIGLWALAKISGLASLRITVTNKTVSLGQPWANRSILRRKVEAIDVGMSALGNYGTIVIHGSGGTPIPVKWVPDPRKLRLAILTEPEIVDMALLERSRIQIAEDPYYDGYDEQYETSMIEVNARKPRPRKPSVWADLGQAIVEFGRDCRDEWRRR
jgi:hypothetical protein